MDHEWKNISHEENDFTNETLLQVENGTLFNSNQNYEIFECV